MDTIGRVPCFWLAMVAVYLVLGGNPSAAESEEGPRSVLVIECPTKEAAKLFYNDPEYASLRLDGINSDSDLKVVFAEGIA